MVLNIRLGRHVCAAHVCCTCQGRKKTPRKSHRRGQARVLVRRSAVGLSAAWLSPDTVHSGATSGPSRALRTHRRTTSEKDTPFSTAARLSLLNMCSGKERVACFAPERGVPPATVPGADSSAPSSFFPSATPLAPRRAHLGNIVSEDEEHAPQPTCTPLRRLQGSSGVSPIPHHCRIPKRKTRRLVFDTALDSGLLHNLRDNAQGLRYQYCRFGRPSSS